jgi:hypothetical protein
MTTADGYRQFTHHSGRGIGANTMSIHYRGSDVVDPTQRLIGTIDDVVYDEQGQPVWAVVDLGLLRSAHYLPIAAGYLTENGTFVVPYDKGTVKAAPKARRDHLLDRQIEAELVRHYELAS